MSTRETPFKSRRRTFKTSASVHFEEEDMFLSWCRWKELRVEVVGLPGERELSRVDLARCEF